MNLTLNWSVSDKSALILAGASTILIFLKKAVFDFLDAPFDILVSIGPFFEGAIASILAGSVFFLTVNRISDMRDRELIEPWVSRKRAFIVGQFDEILREISKISGFSLSAESPLEDFVKAFSGIEERSNAPLVNFDGNHYTWMPYLKYQIDRVQGGIESLLDRGVYLTSTEVRDLIELEDHYFVPMINSISGLPMRQGQTLEFLASSFFEFSKKLDDQGFRSAQADKTPSP
ncbi:MAG: hypothetical protein ACKOPM_01755 [Novosphingobium sp.]